MSDNNYTDGMTIGEVIDALKRATPDEEACVHYSFGGLMPTTVAAYRGFYDKPALGWAGSDYWNGSGLKYEEYPTVSALIAELEDAISGREFTGWKGGEYTYNSNDTLYIDNPGESNAVVVDRVELIWDDKWPILHTRKATNL